MAPELIGLLGIVGLLVLLALRVQIAVAMIVVGAVGYTAITGPGPVLARTGADAFHSAATFSLSVIPLFILMGLLLAQTGLGNEVYDALNAFLHRVRGGLGVATVGASSLFGSVSGSAMGSASTMSIVAVPQMQRYDYDDGYAAACTAVGGTLGALIPPSAVLVLYGILTEEPIGQLLIGAIVPGLLTAGLLMLTAYVSVRLRPGLAPSAVFEPVGKLRAVGRIWAVPVIFGTSMGGLYAGVFTPTEAGAVGAFLALLYSLATRRLTRHRLWNALSQTMRTSALIFFMLIAGKMFGFFLSVSGIPRLLGGVVSGMDAAPFLVLLVMFLFYFTLGMIMDEIGILVIMTPIFYPIVIELGFDGVWFGVLTIMMLLTGLLTPPVGLISFVVSGITDIPVGKVFRRVTPFWLTLAFAIVLVIAFPQLVLFLPQLMA